MASKDNTADSKSTKRQKLAHYKCIICNNTAAISELQTPDGFDSWSRLLDVAKIRNFAPITDIKLSASQIPEIFYHRKCRNDFTYKKDLKKISDISGKNHDAPCDQETGPKLRDKREKCGSSSSRTYPELCIFCNKNSKYIKNTRTREILTKATTLQSDQTLRDLATKRMDD